MRTFICEPDVSVGCHGEIVNRGEFVAEIVVEEGDGFAGGGIQGVDSWGEDSICSGASAQIYEAVVVSGAGWKVDGRIRRPHGQCWGVLIQVYNILRGRIRLQSREEEQVQVWLVDWSFVTDRGN